MKFKESRTPIVIDTNSLVSRLILPKSIPAQAVDLALEKGVILISKDTISELSEVIQRKKFDRYSSIGERLKFFEDFIKICKTVNITEKITTCRDPKDNKFLELAVSGKASVIITGDQDLLSLNPFRSIKILKSHDFLKRFI